MEKKLTLMFFFFFFLVNRLKMMTEMTDNEVTTAASALPSQGQDQHNIPTPMDLHLRYFPNPPPRFQNDVTVSQLHSPCCVANVVMKK